MDVGCLQSIAFSLLESIIKLMNLDIVVSSIVNRIVYPVHEWHHYSHPLPLLTLSASSPILFIHLSTNSLFSASNLSLLCSAIFSCNCNATISSCAVCTSLAFPRISSSLSRSLRSAAAFWAVCWAIWLVDCF